MIDSRLAFQPWRACHIAEQSGRRSITCDTSRVALTLAKQRLMTSVFDYFELAHPALVPYLSIPPGTSWIWPMGGRWIQDFLGDQ